MESFLLGIEAHKIVFYEAPYGSQSVDQVKIYFWDKTDRFDKKERCLELKFPAREGSDWLRATFGSDYYRIERQEQALRI